MRTVLLSSVAALALTVATGSLAQAPMPGMAPATANNPPPPGNAAPATSEPSSSEAPGPDAATTTPPAPMRHVHHVHRAVASSDGNGQDGHWAHEPGTGESGPASIKASNISAQDTHSDIAPHLPQPAVGPGATPESYLQAAESALDRHRTGAAQQALEMAETRLLDRSTAVDAANQPDQGPAIQQITKARDALASGNLAAARSSIRMAMANTGSGGGSDAGAGQGATGNPSLGSNATGQGASAGGNAGQGTMSRETMSQGTMSQGTMSRGTMNQGMPNPGGTGQVTPGAGQGAMGNPSLGNNTTGQGAVPAGAGSGK